MFLLFLRAQTSAHLLLLCGYQCGTDPGSCPGFPFGIPPSGLVSPEHGHGKKSGGDGLVHAAFGFGDGVPRPSAQDVAAQPVTAKSEPGRLKGFSGLDQWVIVVVGVVGKEEGFGFQLA